jgi:hypothetical protein
MKETNMERNLTILVRCLVVVSVVFVVLSISWLGLVVYWAFFAENRPTNLSTYILICLVGMAVISALPIEPISFIRPRRRQVAEITANSNHSMIFAPEEEKCDVASRDSTSGAGYVTTSASVQEQPKKLKKGKKRKRASKTGSFIPGEIS